MARKPEMTAAEWAKSRAPAKMLPHVRKCGDLRKLRLFACACCRAVWDHLTNEHCRRGVEIAELYADGLVTETAREEAQRRVSETLDEGGQRDLLRLCADWAVCRQDAWLVSFSTEVVASNSRSIVGRKLQRIQADLLRCVFGNPFTRVAAKSSWGTSDVLHLAKGIYDERDFTGMPILADALQEAGCEQSDILSHCRDTSIPHVRGCWVIDLVLGKS